MVGAQHFTVAELRTVLREEAGVIYWTVTRGGCALAGDAAGRYNRNGYIEVRYRNRTLLSHRLVWAFCTGDWPSTWLDHINGVRDDNRIENLRLCDNRQNQANRKIPAGRYKGVTLHKQTGKYQVAIGNSYVGLFADPETAARAYDAEARRLYGEYSRLNLPSATQ